MTRHTITVELQQIRKVLEEVKLIREELNAMKNGRAASNDEQPSHISSVNTSSLDEEMRQLRDELTEVKSALAMIQQQQDIAALNRSTLDEDVRQLRQQHTNVISA